MFFSASMMVASGIAEIIRIARVDDVLWTHVKRSGMRTIPLSGINHGFRSHLGQMPLVLAARVSFRTALQETTKKNAVCYAGK